MNILILREVGSIMLTMLASILIGSLKSCAYMIGMIKSNAFPKPLSKEDEALYIAKFAEGDMEARNKLIEHNLRLAAHVAKKFDNKGEIQEDLVSIGVVGLIKGIESFSPEKGTKLATYVARCIENEILMHFRNNRKSQKDVSLHDAIGQDKEGNEITLIDILSTDQNEIADSVENEMEKTRIHKYIDLLDEREKEVVCWRFGINNKSEKTQRQVARDLGISRSYVSRIEKRALIKLFHRLYHTERRKPYGMGRGDL